MQRYFLNEIVNEQQQFRLNKGVYRHWIRVMRAELGAEAEFVDSNGQLYLGKLVNLSESNAEVQIEQRLESNSELPVEVTLIMGLPKQDKAEWITQKATELGVANIIFFQADWSIAQWKPNRIEAKLDRLTKIALGAAEQSHRTRVPNVTFERNLSTVIKAYQGKILVAYEESAKSGEKAALLSQLEQLHGGDPIAAVVGPEGGVSPAEIELLTDNEAVKVGLGPRIMRTETAPLYFLAAVSVVMELQR